MPPEYVVRYIYRNIIIEENILLELRAYFEQRADVSMAFLFGSEAKGTAEVESDADIAVYFTPQDRRLEWEEDREYEALSEIWSAVDGIVRAKSTDVVVLNTAPSMLVAGVLETGRPLIVKDKELLWRLWITTTDAAEQFRQIKEDWRAISARSQSITYFDKERLLDRIEFMERELEDLPKFMGMTYEQYRSDRDKRRNVERWVENIVNASIDIAKTLLASEKRETPMKYAEVMQALVIFETFPHEVAEQMADFAKTRNWLTHEYLDMSFDRIQKFVKIAGSAYPKLLDLAHERISQNKTKLHSLRSRYLRGVSTTVAGTFRSHVVR